MTEHHAPERTKVSVLGGGSWGTALAIHCARMGHDTVIWARGSATVDAINTAHENTLYLPGYPCPTALRASSDMAEVVQRSELILMVVPTQYIKETLAEASQLLRPHQILVSCSKGISLQTLETVEEVLEGLVPEGFRGRLAYLSGPSFAAEVAAGHPTAVTVAAKDDALAARVQLLLSNARFRCYRSTDVVGVELGGALKNVLAIACGISDGLGFGNNGRAALITRGLYEITKLAVARGANPLTMAGLAGMGDLVLTCTGDLSRNRTVGLRLGRGERLADIQVSMGGAVAEGVPTAIAIHNLSRKLGVECPIMEGIHRVIHEGADAQTVVTEVMSRELKPEVAPDIIRGVIATTSTPSASSSHSNLTALSNGDTTTTATTATSNTTAAVSGISTQVHAVAAATAAATCFREGGGKVAGPHPPASLPPRPPRPSSHAGMAGGHEAGSTSPSAAATGAGAGEEGPASASSCGNKGSGGQWGQGLWAMGGGGGGEGSGAQLLVGAVLGAAVALAAVAAVARWGSRH